MDTLVVFSKLTYAVTSELAQGALPLHSTWVGFMVLLHVVLQSLQGKEVLGTEWTLINMCSTAKEGGPFSLITRPFPQYGGKLQQIHT